MKDAWTTGSPGNRVQAWVPQLLLYQPDIHKWRPYSPSQASGSFAGSRAGCLGWASLKCVPGPPDRFAPTQLWMGTSSMVPISPPFFFSPTHSVWSPQARDQFQTTVVTCATAETMPRSLNCYTAQELHRFLNLLEFITYANLA